MLISCLCSQEKVDRKSQHKVIQCLRAFMNNKVNHIYTQRLAHIFMNRQNASIIVAIVLSCSFSKMRWLMSQHSPIVLYFFALPKPFIETHRHTDTDISLLLMLIKLRTQTEKMDSLCVCLCVYLRVAVPARVNSPGLPWSPLLRVYVVPLMIRLPSEDLSQKGSCLIRRSLLRWTEIGQGSRDTTPEDHGETSVTLEQLSCCAGPSLALLFEVKHSAGAAVSQFLFQHYSSWIHLKLPKLIHLGSQEVWGGANRNKWINCTVWSLYIGVYLHSSGFGSCLPCYPSAVSY